MSPNVVRLCYTALTDIRFLTKCMEYHVMFLLHFLFLSNLCLIHVIVFSCYSYDNYHLSTSAGRDAKERQMERLMDDINKKNATFRNRIYINLPLAASHAKHTVSIESAFANRMHIKLKERIREHVKMGITSVTYIRKMLNRFVDKELSSENCVSPSSVALDHYFTHFEKFNLLLSKV